MNLPSEHLRIGCVSVVMLLTVCVSEVRSQTGPYIQMDLGTTVAPPLTVQGSDNDWGTKCDLIINPLGVEAGGECESSVGRGETILYRMTTDARRSWGVSLSLRYGF